MAPSAQQVLKEGSLCVPLEDNSCFQCKAKQLGHSIVYLPISKRYDLPGMRGRLPRGRGHGRTVGRGGRFIEAGSVVIGSASVVTGSMMTGSVITGTVIRGVVVNKEVVTTVEGLTMEGSVAGVKDLDAER
jgi:hypothetical protein